MDFNAIITAVSTVGFPIVCCGVLFIQNNKLRDTVEENTKAIIALSDYIKYYDRDEYYSFAYPKKILKEYKVDEFPNIVWALMVIMFGDYGTSPRFGWIDVENKEKALVFLNSINKKYDQNYEE